ncbi:collagen-like triple helix repeat-containing protein, partial [Psychrobacter sp. FBL11]
NNSSSPSSNLDRDRDNSVSVGSASNQRQIINVEYGAADHDAVNDRQLQAEKTKAIETVSY